MSAPDILANMSRGWNRDPAGVALGTEKTGVLAALWTHDQDDVQEVWAEPDLERHILTVVVAPLRIETYANGKLSFAGMHRPHSLTLIRAGERPRGVLHGRFRVLHFYIPKTLIHLALEGESQSHQPCELIAPKGDHDPAIERISREVLAEMREGQPLSRLRVDLLGQDVAIQLLRRWSNLAGTHALTHEPARGGLAPWQVARVSDYLLADLSADPGLAELAALVSLSPEHFCRAFKASTGLPPHAWLVARRVERARELLDGTSLAVEEIAARVGYAEPSHLARMFRRAHGLSPTQYRRERLS